MRKCILLAACFLLLTASVAQAAEMKIGVVNIQQVMESTQTFKQLSAQMKAKIEPKQKEIEKEKNRIEAMAKALNANSPDSKKQEFIKAQEAFSKKGNDFLEYAQKEDMAMRTKIEGYFIEASKNVAQKKGLNIVLDLQGVMYYENSMDVTKDVATELDRLWKAKGGK